MKKSVINHKIDQLVYRIYKEWWDYDIVRDCLREAITFGYIKGQTDLTKEIEGRDIFRRLGDALRPE